VGKIWAREIEDRAERLRELERELRRERRRQAAERRSKVSEGDAQDQARGMDHSGK
jgi:hypothetical protein